VHEKRVCLRNGNCNSILIGRNFVNNITHADDEVLIYCACGLHRSYKQITEELQWNKHYSCPKIFYLFVMKSTLLTIYKLLSLSFLCPVYCHMSEHKWGRLEQDRVGKISEWVSIHFSRNQMSRRMRNTTVEEGITAPLMALSGALYLICVIVL
jgi:hypothetical protein